MADMGVCWRRGLISGRVLTGRAYWKTPDLENASVHALLVEILFAPLELASARAATFGPEAELPAGFDAWFAGCVVAKACTR